MAENYRDPKVTTTESASAGGGMGKYIMYAVIAILALLILAWLLGWLGGEADVVATDPDAVVVTDGDGDGDAVVVTD